MVNIQPEFHGSRDQQSVQRKAAALWALVRDDLRFGSHGRAIAVAYSVSALLEAQIALTRLVGASACEFVPTEAAGEYVSKLEDAGLKTDTFQNWQTGPDALNAARNVIKSRPLADDLELVSVSPQSPPGDLAALNTLTQSCGVLLPNGAFMRGQERPAVCIFVRDRQGTPVCTSAAVTMFHPDHPLGKQSWWGMLATHPNRRGEGLALNLGAQSMLAQHERFGNESFFTGIREGNTASENLCTKLGLAPSGHTIVVAIEPSAFSGNQITK